MSGVRSVEGGGVARRSAGLGAADVLALAAAPVFAIMAVVTEVSGGGAMEMPGHAAPGFPLSEMATMYLLMAVFNAAPWVRWVRAGKGTTRPRPPAVIPARGGTQP